MAKSMAKQIRRCGRSSPSTTRYLLVGKDGHANLDTQLIWLKVEDGRSALGANVAFLQLGFVWPNARLGWFGQNGPLGFGWPKRGTARVPARPAPHGQGLSGPFAARSFLLLSVALQTMQKFERR
jgi:hypothetical protein